MNLTSLSITPEGIASARELATRIPGLISIAGFDPVQQVWRRLEMIDGELQGEDFALAALQGLAIEMEADYETLLSGFANQLGLSLNRGLNLVGLSHVPDAYTAFELLGDLGGPSRVSAITCINPDSGRIETAAYRGDMPAGIDFPIHRGAGYLVSMHEAVEAVLMP